MSEDEEDYMSDKFLAGMQAAPAPSLIKNRAKKRQINVEAHKIEHIKRQREDRFKNTSASRNEKLQESLKIPIAEENKGFQMLAKMGYKPGQALGKQPDAVTSTTTKVQRLLEPIGINIKADRGGLGREAALQELAAKRRVLREQRLNKHAGGKVSIEEFRKRATQKAEDRFTQGALSGCQMTCENLDIKNKVLVPDMSWFWPERESLKSIDDEEQAAAAESASEEDEQEEAEIYTNSEKLELLTSYMRTAYNFCFWCGIEYKDKTDIDNNCPGLTRDEH